MTLVLALVDHRDLPAAEDVIGRQANFAQDLNFTVFLILRNSVMIFSWLVSLAIKDQAARIIPMLLSTATKMVR